MSAPREQKGKGYKIMTKYEIERNRKIHVYAQVNYAQTPRKGLDNGAGGRAFELECTPRKSKKTTVSNQGVVDNRIYIKQSDNSVKCCTLECKTNGGGLSVIENYARQSEIDGIPRYVVYRLDFCNSTSKGKHIVYPAIVCECRVFMEAVIACGAVKATNEAGTFRNYSLQPSKRAWWSWVDAYPVKFEANRIYDSWEFEF